MSKLVALVVSHATAILLGVVGMAMLAGSCHNWRVQQRLETRPVVLEPTKTADKAERRALTPEEAQTLCAGLQPISGGKALRTSQERNPALSGSPDAPQTPSFKLGEVQLLAADKVPPSEEGGEVEVTLASGAREPALTFYPAPKKWLEGMSIWRIEATVGIDQHQASAFVGSVSWKGLRTGRLDHGVALVGCYSPGLPTVGVVGYRVGFE